MPALTRLTTVSRRSVLLKHQDHFFSLEEEDPISGSQRELSSHKTCHKDYEGYGQRVSFEIIATRNWVENLAKRS